MSRKQEKVLIVSSFRALILLSSAQVRCVQMDKFPLGKAVLVAGLLWGLIGGKLGWAQEGMSSDSSRAEILVARADSLRGERQFEAARQLYRQARRLYRRNGPLTEVASMTGDIGVVYYLQGDLEASSQAFQKAISIARRAGARENVANLLNNIGLIEWRRGEYDAALVHLKESVQIHREKNNQDRVGRALNNIANIYEERGQFRRALRTYRESLSNARVRNDSADVASYLNNIGLVLRSQGRYEEALRRHAKALKLHRSRGAERSVASALNNMGIVWEEQGRYEKALEVYQEALRINRDLEDRAGIASNLNNIGVVYQRQGKEEKALETLRKGLHISREVEEQASVAVTLNDLGEVYRGRGAYDKDLTMYRKALRINRSLGRSEGLTKSLDGIGLTHLEQGRYAAADSVLQAAIAITDTLIATAKGGDQRDFLAQEMDRFHTRVVAQVRAGAPEAALRTLERGRTRVFAERLAEQRKQGGSPHVASSVPPVDSLQQALDPQEAALLYANTDAPGPITAFVVTRSGVQAHEISDSSFVAWARRTFQDKLNRLERQEDDLLAKAKGLDAGETLSSLVRLYRHDLAAPPGRQLLSAERRSILSRELYSLLIEPLKDTLGGGMELVVVPDGALAYLPFETLQNRHGDYLVQNWRVQYTQSLRVLHLLRQRNARGADSSARKSLLALGGAVYDAKTYAADTASSTSGGPVLAEAAPSSRTPGRTTGRAPVEASTEPRATRGSATRSYRQMGYGPEQWYNLGGTLREIRALGRIVGSSTLLVGEHASEKTLRQLSEAGALDDYRALHFATHGFVVPEAPSLSALVFSEVSQERSAVPRSHAPSDTTAFNAVDGYLNMQEIAQLDLNAEFVALSACETGLGRIYRGSGAVSLAQAFLRAGAGSVAVSLWPVYDASTSRFMEAVYRRAWQYDTAWAEAIAETKRGFIEGDYGKRLQAPRFWAPFVYYGREAHSP